MCVIIDREAGATIPFDKLELACDINKHGYGLAIPNKGHIIVIRSSKQPNDPKEVQDLLDKHRSQRVLLHLRHATVGEVAEHNTHPFHILQKKSHGLDLVFMHNGTLWDYNKTKNGDSDTKAFAQQFLIPLALRVNKFSGKKVLEDDFFKRVVTKESGYMSVFVLMDGMGNTLITNKDKGKQFTGWWASNDYSFNKNHIRARAQLGTTGYNRDYSGIYDHLDPWEDAADEVVPAFIHNRRQVSWEDEFKAGTKHNVHNMPIRSATSNTENTRTKYECQRVGGIINSAIYKIGESLMAENGAIIQRELKVLKDSFTKLAEIASLDALARLTEADIVSIGENFPRATARLVIDLMHERAVLMQNNKRQADRIIELSSEMANKK